MTNLNKTTFIFATVISSATHATPTSPFPSYTLQWRAFINHYPHHPSKSPSPLLHCHHFFTLLLHLSSKSGCIDPITDIAALGLQRGISVHVDACLGGFLIPFMEEGVASVSLSLYLYLYLSLSLYLYLYLYLFFCDSVSLLVFFFQPVFRSLLSTSASPAWRAFPPTRTSTATRPKAPLSSCTGIRSSGTTRSVGSFASADDDNNDNDDNDDSNGNDNDTLQSWFVGIRTEHVVEPKTIDDDFREGYQVNSPVKARIS